MERTSGRREILILVDHNIEGQAAILYRMLVGSGWAELASIEFITFADVALDARSNDRLVWRFAQQNGMILLTGNRRMSGQDALEKVIREENSLSSRPVITISVPDRMDEYNYRDRCASRLVEIVVDLHTYMGVGRVFIP